MGPSYEMKIVLSKLLGDPDVQDSYFQECPEYQPLCEAVFKLVGENAHYDLREMAPEDATLSWFQDRLWDDSDNQVEQEFGPWVLKSAYHESVGKWFWLVHNGDTGSGQTYSGVFYWKQ